MARYDIAIIGTGPAGISAAITAKIRQKDIVLLGSSRLSDKIEKAHLIQNYPGLPEISGEELQKAFLRHMGQMGISITEERINAVYPMGDFFGLQTNHNEMLEARSVIIASGVAQGRLLPGEEELVGRGVSYCATCDAALYRGRPVAVLGYTKEAEEEASFLSEVAESVKYFPVYKDEVQTAAGVEIVREMPTGISRLDEMGSPENKKDAAGDKLVVRTRQGMYTADGVFVLRSSISPGQLMPGLELEDDHVAVNLRMETSIAGCFACGDITGKPYQYVKAAGQGNVAALSAVSYLDNMATRAL